MKMPFPAFRMLLAMLTIIGIIAACKSFGSKQKTEEVSIKNKPNTVMPIPPLPGAPGDYADDWRAVDSLQGQELYKSALEKVEMIENRAKKDKNKAQIVKALLYRGKFTTFLQEDGLTNAVQLMETEMQSAAQPEKAILQSILGQLYATYLQSQGWQLRNRTPVAGTEGGDILTWSADQVERHALELYAASVEQDAFLRNIPIEQFQAVVFGGSNDSINNKLIRPTLFDLLATRAIDHFSNERNYLNEPAYAFQLSDADDFSDAKSFSAKKYTTKDSTSGKWLAIRVFQQLLRSRESGDPVAAKATQIDADLRRLQFVYNNSTREDKSELYLKALDALKSQSTGHPSYGEVVYAHASHLYYVVNENKAANNKAAVAELEAVQTQFPDSYGTLTCKQLLEQIKAPQLQTQVEKVYLPGQAALVSLQVRNMTKAWVSVFRDDFSLEKDFMQYDQAAALAYLKKLPKVQERSWDIQNPGDYLDHHTEVALEALPVGNYRIVVSETQEFDPKKHPLCLGEFTVSNIASVQYGDNNGTNFVLAHRQTGAPLQGVKLEFFAPDYSRSGGPHFKKLSGSSTSDREGLAKSRSAENGSFQVLATLGSDSLWLGWAYGESSRNWPESPATVQFFTDRSIYRPGQTVYFKGILHKPAYKPGEVPKILPNQSVTVQFYDANRQSKGELKLKSNEFGTFNGAFTAPATGLTGQMSLQVSGGATGSAYFRVEEYKRPRFEVSIKPVEGAYRVNDKVTVRGEAKNYAGSVVDGAQVKYRVVRVARFPFWDFFRSWSRPWYLDRPEMEIANGSTTTGDDGTFSIDFNAIPDPVIPKKDQPVFDYQVSIDVTDITGETRSNSATLSAGYVALQVNWALPGEVSIDSLPHIGLSTTNMSGQAQAAQGQVSIQKLVDPGVFYKARLWERPDLATIPKADFERLFPGMAWKDEDNPEKWGRQDLTRNVKFNTASDKTVDLLQNGMQPGWYVFKLSTQDTYGEKVEIEKYVRVWDAASRFVTPGAIAEKQQMQPGETARFLFGGKPSDLYFFFAQEDEGGLKKPEWVSGRIKNLAQVEIPIRENDRGGIITYYFCIRDNRVYGVDQLRVEVPWSNKELNISYESFRDKLAPGQKEEWKIKISGPKKEKVAAEMVAAMYDASLDQFSPHGWYPLAYPLKYSQIRFDNNANFSVAGANNFYFGIPSNYPSRTFHELNLFDFPMWGRNRYEMSEAVVMRSAAPAGRAMEPRMEKEEAMTSDEIRDLPTRSVNAIVAQTAGKAKADEAPPSPPQPAAPAPAPPASIRRNLNETVFFFPELRTDAEGNVVLKFTMNEALTRWKLLTYAHTKDLQQAVSAREVVTQKELMVIPNPPRFLRQGDEIEFSAKVSNLSKEQLEGTASLTLLDAATLAVVESDFGLAKNNRIARFSVLPGQSGAVSWRVKVPEDYSGAVTWQIFADGKSYRDGEESTIPVVSNRMLVTETLPISARANQTKTVSFESLKNNQASTTLKPQRLTLEFSSNPVWYAVQSLPYLMEFPHECSEQIFSRLYANTLAANVVEKMPNIKRVYERWKGTEAMKSNLSKNQELKYALLEETPWVLDAQDEEKQKQNIALLFDLNRMADERERALSTLAERQTGSGGWPWFSGGAPSWYITQYIATGFRHLEKLGALNVQNDPASQQMLNKAVSFCDQQINEQYAQLERLAKEGKTKMEDDHLDGMAIQYLYMKSFRPVDRPGKELAYYLTQAEKYWTGKGLYQEGMIALAMQRFSRKGVASNIVASLRERATTKEELGMFWPVDWGFYWYQLPVETQALMVEVFSEVANDTKSVEELRIWLLKNKQTNRWESTKATAEAVYALLLNGDNWLNNTQNVKVSMGGTPVNVQEYEAGTGYFKQSWSAAEIKKSWSEVKVENPNSNIVWGAAYFQYFEDLDKIKDFKKTPLTIVKQLFLEENSPTGPVLKPIADGQVLHRGDKVKVRIEIRVDRAMEFVHLKDMRAAGLEPVNVLSGYKWQGGLGYYESTKDLATNFFIDYLPRGTFVFEYPLVVSLRGDMSNGITTMQCMYAPEFSSHSAGIRVRCE